MAAGTLAIIILAAGSGTRMHSAVPKVLHPLAGRPMIGHVAAAVARLAPARIVVVAAPGIAGLTAPVMDACAAAGGACEVLTAIQDPPLGTGHAVAAARAAVGDGSDDILVVYGDSPLIGSDTLAALLGRRRQGRAIAVAGFRPADPAAYGRLVIGPDGDLERIVEAGDASPEELAMPLCNGGVMAADGRILFDLLQRVGNANAKGEYYLTDVVGVARDRGLRCVAVETATEEVLGVNSRSDLAAAEAVMQKRLRRAAMEQGVTLLDPESVYFSFDTRLAADVTVEPHVFFGPGVRVGEGARICAFSHLEGVTVEAQARIGPHARLRPGTTIGIGAHVGNFVEVKNATIAAGAKANHLSYIGDATVGADANIGAGTITCNYDGFGKYRTTIGAGAFIGSNSALVAPVSIGDTAIVGAGSAIAEDVPAGALAVTRGPLRLIDGGAERVRARARARRQAQDRDPARKKD